MIEENFDQIKGDQDDLETVRKTVEYLEENYTEPFDQGPIFMFGSSIEENIDKYPNDFDILVRRKPEDQRKSKRKARGITKNDPRRKVVEDTVFGGRDRKRSGTVDPQEDYKVLAEMMKELSENDEFKDYREDLPNLNPMSYLDRSEKVRDYGNIGQTHDPVTRVEIELECTDLDIVFSNHPERNSLKLTRDEHY